MDDLFADKSQKIRVFLGTEVEADPYDKDKTVTYLNPIPISAVVNELIASQISYKLPGIETSGAMEIIVRKKYRPLIEQSQKFEITCDGEEYEGWRVNGKMQIRQDGDDYIRCYIYRV